MSSRQISVDHLTRVEGEGGLQVVVEDGQVTDVRLHIFEPPRLFEAFLVGRSYEELPDLTARVCGICPTPYQMSATQAAENAFGASIDEQVRRLRRLALCGEWISSHCLSIFLLAAPDFLGYSDAFAMAKDHPEVVRRGLFLKRLGNDLSALIGGREIHPVSACVGGFHRVPTMAELATLVDRLEQGKQEARETVQWTASLPLPELALDREYVALSHPDEYGMDRGRVVSNKGLDIGVSEFLDHIEEKQVPYSTALHASIKGRGAYCTGPLARVNLNFDRLTPDAQEAARASGVPFPNDNPFTSIVARAIEVLHAVDEAGQIVAQYRRPAPFVPVPPRAGTGHGLTEAPRGALYHRYTFDEEGMILDARLVPPTAQNQRQIEDDLRAFAPRTTTLPPEEAARRCATVVRNYDPCISCSAHVVRARKREWGNGSVGV